MKNSMLYSNCREILLWPLMAKALLVDIALFTLSVCTAVYINASLVAIPIVLGVLIIPICIILSISMFEGVIVDLPVKEKRSLRPKGWRKIEREARRQKYINELEEELGFEVSV